jgi:hypothetical protein
VRTGTREGRHLIDELFAEHGWKDRNRILIKQALETAPPAGGGGQRQEVLEGSGIEEVDDEQLEAEAKAKAEAGEDEDMDEEVEGVVGVSERGSAADRVALRILAGAVNEKALNERLSRLQEAAERGGGGGGGKDGGESLSMPDGPEAAVAQVTGAAS